MKENGIGADFLENFPTLCFKLKEINFHIERILPTSGTLYKWAPPKPLWHFRSHEVRKPRNCKTQEWNWGETSKNDEKSNAGEEGAVGPRVLTHGLASAQYRWFSAKGMEGQMNGPPAASKSPRNLASKQRQDHKLRRGHLSKYVKWRLKWLLYGK